MLGVLALVLSAPPRLTGTTSSRSTAPVRDLEVCYGSSGPDSDRHPHRQIWIAVAADLTSIIGSVTRQWFAVDCALLAFSLLGRAAGCPLAGKMSDVLARRGVSRTTVIIGGLVLATVLFHVLSLGVTAIGSLAVIAVLLGMSVNLFSLIPAAISDRFGSQRTASLSAFANTLAQLSGATALAVSGYVGISLNAQPGNALTEYRGIWLSAEVGMAFMTILSIAAYIALRKGGSTGPCR